MVKYEANQTPKEVSDGFKNFFTNTDSENCPITSCTLKSAGCLTEYEGLHVKIAEATPFQLTASVDVIKGYEESVCVECISKLA